MKIISKFKDYYDGLQTHDADDLIYVRNQEIFECNGWKVPPAPSWLLNPNGSLQINDPFEIHMESDKKVPYSFYGMSVIFCGIEYHGFLAWHWPKMEIAPGIWGAETV